MTFCSFAISAGLSVASPPNVETFLTYPPHVLPSSEATYTGPVVKRMASGRMRRVGRIYDRWHWDLLSQTDFNALIVAIFGNFTTDHADVTYVTIDEAGHYARFNGSADKPHPGDDYTDQGNGLDKRDLTLTFARLASLGEFSAEFTEEFTL